MRIFNIKVNEKGGWVEFHCYSKSCNFWTTAESDNNIKILYKDGLILLCGNCQESKAILKKYEKLLIMKGTDNV